MKVKVKELSYLFGEMVPAGAVYDYPDDKLARNDKGDVDWTKHSALEPLARSGAKAAKPAVPASRIVQDEEAETETEDTESDDGEDAELTEEEKAQTILDNVNALEHSNDDHWTKAGLPSVTYLTSTMGFPVTRAEVEAAAPGVTRPAE